MVLGVELECNGIVDGSRNVGGCENGASSSADNDLVVDWFGSRSGGRTSRPTGIGRQVT